MSNKILFGVLGTTAATATIAAPATLLSGGGGGSQGNFQESLWVGKNPKLSSSTDIKGKYKEVDCLNEYFKEKIDWESPLQGDDEPSLNFQSTDKDNPKGCLIVEYYQGHPNYKDKWWGGFRLIWSVANDKEGLIAVFNSRTHSGNYEFDSAVYIVKKDGQKWSSKYQQENQVGIISTDDELVKKFPKSSHAMFSSGQQDYWAFGPMPTKACKGYECNGTDASPNATEQPMKWNWKKSNSGKPINEWCANFDDWFDSLLADNKDKWSEVKKALKELKGTWTQSN